MQFTDVTKVYTEMFNEETRLCRSNSSSIEYITNMKYILAELLSAQIDKLSEEKFTKWMNYHLYTCEKPEALGASHHLLYITKK